MTDFIDVSYHDGLIDWTKVRPQFNGSIVKAGDGWFMPVEFKNGEWWFYTSDPAKRWHQDIYFARNWQALAGAEIRGAYWFLRLEEKSYDPDRTIPRQAEIFKQAVMSNGLLPTDYIVVDIEQTSSQIAHLTIPQKRAKVKQFLDLCEMNFGRKPILYTFPYWWMEHIGIAGWELNYKLWIADVEAPLTIPKPWTSYWAHQFSWAGVVAGINASVDMNNTGADYVAASPVPPTTEPTGAEKLSILWADYIQRTQ